ncbi:unnamed protein product [Durusdinium trenchii]|uniref:Uncharacterized protein n=1 Tax=Durusdinium trenchii TaxID=1381693 RepID=A0ABP0PNV1_9DINO
MAPKKCSPAGIAAKAAGRKPKLSVAKARLEANVKRQKTSHDGNDSAALPNDRKGSGGPLISDFMIMIPKQEPQEDSFAGDVICKEEGPPSPVGTVTLDSFVNGFQSEGDWKTKLQESWKSLDDGDLASLMQQAVECPMLKEYKILQDTKPNNPVDDFKLFVHWLVQKKQQAATHPAATLDKMGNTRSTASLETANKHKATSISAASAKTDFEFVEVFLEDEAKCVAAVKQHHLFPAYLKFCQKHKPFIHFDWTHPGDGKQVDTVRNIRHFNSYLKNAEAPLLDISKLLRQYEAAMFDYDSTDDYVFPDLLLRVRSHPMFNEFIEDVYTNIEEPRYIQSGWTFGSWPHNDFKKFNTFLIQKGQPPIDLAEAWPAILAGWHYGLSTAELDLLSEEDFISALSAAQGHPLFREFWSSQLLEKPHQPRFASSSAHQVSNLESFVIYLRDTVKAYMKAGVAGEEHFNKYFGKMAPEETAGEGKQEQVEVEESKQAAMEWWSNCDPEFIANSLMNDENCPYCLEDEISRYFHFLKAEEFVDDDYSYGDPEGDPVEDLVHFLRWFQKSPHSKINTETVTKRLDQKEAACMGVGADDGQVDEISEPGDVYDARIPVAEAEELVRRAVDAYPDPEDVMGSAAEVFEDAMRCAVQGLKPAFNLDMTETVASVSTFNGCLESIERETDDSSESNLKLCIDEIEKRGYAVECILLDAEWFGLPQSRRRVYFVCLDLRNQDIAVSAASFFEDVKTLIRQMYLEENFLLPDDDPALAEHFEFLSDRDDVADSDGGWTSLHMSVAEKRGIPWPLQIPKAVQASKWFPLLTKRAREVVGFAADDKYRMKKKVSVADVYHSANRYSTGTRSLPVILPRSIAWSFAKQRPLLGRELLRCQGHSYDHDFLSSFTESQLGNLAGNAFAGNVIVAVVLAVMCSLRYSSESEMSEAEDIRKMVQSLTEDLPSRP